MQDCKVILQTESPAKDMKKKMAANAEKEKNAVEQTTSKTDKPVDKPTEKPADKPTDKSAEKPKADKPAEKKAIEKSEKPVEKKATEKSEKPAEKKATEKSEKPVEKKATEKSEKPAEKKDKPAEKKDGHSEKKKEENGKGESSGKTDKPANGKPKHIGNGVNGAASAESDSDETELFPELAYDDSDVEFVPGDCPSRSLTRRSQVKAARTPETPRPASDKQEDESKDSKVLKLTQDDKKSDAKADKKSDAKDAKSDRKSDAKEAKSEKKDAKKPDTPKKIEEIAKVDAKKDKESPKKDDKGKSGKVEIEIVVDIESNGDPSEESRKPDTNFSKSRVKVSPYRRSMRLADQTTSSMAANYTGNNTTMEMDITEISSFMDDSVNDDSYLSGLRNIKGRRSYKLLKDLPPRPPVNRSVRSVTSTIVSDHSTRPTAPVVGRKRKPEAEDNISFASEAEEEAPLAGKRQRLLDRLARPFRRTALMPVRRNAEIVGINTDLPLTAPVASTSSFDPESLKTAPALEAAVEVPVTPIAVNGGEESKRCIIM